jgi:hypothetical protein
MSNTLWLLMTAAWGGGKKKFVLIPAEKALRGEVVDI